MIPGLALIREANKIFPETRLVWVALAVVAALAAIDSFRLGWAIAALGAIVLLVLSILFFIVSGVCAYLANPTEKNAVLKYPAMVLAWTFTIGISAFVGLSMSCFFIGKPTTLAGLFTLGNTVVTVGKGDVRQDPPIVRPLTSYAPTINTFAGAPPQSSNNLDRCLAAIDAAKLSVGEVQSRARECLRTQR